MCTAVLIGRVPATHSPHSIWAHIRGRCWSPKIDDISSRPPAGADSKKMSTEPAGHLGVGTEGSEKK
jgi:hypothetical protein